MMELSKHYSFEYHIWYFHWEYNRIHKVRHWDVELRKSIEDRRFFWMMKMTMVDCLPYWNDYSEQREHFQHWLNHFSYCCTRCYLTVHWYDDEKDERKLDVVVLKGKKTRVRWDFRVNAYLDWPIILLHWLHKHRWYVWLVEQLFWRFVWKNLPEILDGRVKQLSNSPIIPLNYLPITKHEQYSNP